MNQVSGEFLTGLALAVFVFGYALGFIVAWRIKRWKGLP